MSLTEMPVDVKDAFKSLTDVPVDVNDAPMPHDGCAHKRHSCAQGSDGSPDRHEERPETPSPLGGDWEVVSENVPHAKKDATELRHVEP